MTLTNHNIEQLVELCKTDNQFAQLELYNRYYKAMYNTAYRIVKNSFEAEDVMQDAFLLAFSKLDTLKEIKTFGAWLKRIVINRSIYHYNKSTKFNEVPLDDVLYKVEDTDGITEDYEFTNIQAKQVMETMKTLKENYRMALTLHLIEGFDYDEISDIMRISSANCRTTISRAKESLRKKMQALVG
ncbi:RNA polymerase sigma factor [Lacinutrix sp. Bg11-31]|uniref:RNA polymerase sigma factor n=1 Tax=Lacinutrix sp. Bg11-31 TaxID=2057808 RepID=UPI000C30DB32|nr:RNA polymerase sigma factor [Lacinutrix sp. Bg11-31]AUC81641.1 RNA polymerase subunit sigma [Lacinutrix sp. Bg11-31]